MIVVAGYGRVASDIEYKENGEMHVAEFRIAIDRRGKDRGTNFFKCVAFRQTADFLHKYFAKGNRIAIDGELDKPDRYKNQNDTWVYPEVQIVVRNVDFVETKAEREQSTSTSTQSAPQKDESFMSIPDGIENDELPFN